MVQFMEKDELRFTYEGALDKLHRIIKWLIVVIVILILSLVGTNLAWVLYENSFETETVRVEQEVGEGNNNFIGEDGIIINK